MKLLVITIRGLQASLVGAYGNHWVSTPTLDALADRGILFDNHYADRASPEGTRHSWLTGRTSPTPAPNLLALLRQADVPTLLVHDVKRPLPPAFLTGWSASVEVEAEGDEDPLDLALQGASAALETLRDEPNALIWLDLPALLPPWNVSDEIVAPLFDYELVEEDTEAETEEDADAGTDEAEEADEEVDLFEDDDPLPEFMPVPPVGPVDSLDQHLALSLRMSCGAAVNALDASLGDFFRWLAEFDPQHELTIVVTSDHGYPLGEHGTVGLEGAGPYEELLHLPLLVRLPKEDQAGRRIDALCQPIDLGVTLASLFGVVLSDAQGTDLGPWLQGKTEQPRPYLVTQSGEGRGALRTEQWSFVQDSHFYLQPEDRWEVNDVRQHHLELVEELETLLPAAQTAHNQPGPLVLPPLPVDEAGTEGADA